MEKNEQCNDFTFQDKVNTLLRIKYDTYKTHKSQIIYQRKVLKLLPIRFCIIIHVKRKQKTKCIFGQSLFALESKITGVNAFIYLINLLPSFSSFHITFKQLCFMKEHKNMSR